MAVPGALTVDVVSDVVCPWCYIGKRRLEAALARLREAEPELPVEVRWHPFQLNPDLPREGIDRRQYLEDKFGGPGRTQQIYARVSAAGATVGIPFAFDAIERQPNTLDAHRLIVWAQARRDGDPDALVEQLFRAYFLDGRFVGDQEELVARRGRGRLRRRRRPQVSRVGRGNGGGRRRRSARPRARRVGRAVLHLRRQDGRVGRA